MNEPNRKRKESAIEHREDDTRKKKIRTPDQKFQDHYFHICTSFSSVRKTLSLSSRFLFEIIVDSNRKLSGNNRQVWQKLVLHHICRTMYSF